MIPWWWLIPASVVSYYLGWLQATRSETHNLLGMIREAALRGESETAGNCGASAGVLLGSSGEKVADLRNVRIRTGRLRRSIPPRAGG